MKHKSMLDDGEWQEWQCCKNRTHSTPCDGPCDSDDVDPENIAVMSVFMGLVVVSVVTTVTVALCCWCYHRKKRRRDLAAISRKGGLNIVLGDDLQRANQEGRLTVNVSLLDTARRHSEQSNYSGYSEKGESLTDPDKKSNQLGCFPSTAKSSIPLTEDGYAILESGNDTVVNEPVKNLSPKNKTFGQDKQAKGNGTTINDHDYEELYWEPANQEEELLSQLSKLGLSVIYTESVELKECLGSGEFGTVQRALWSVRKGEGAKIMEVAVKSLEQGTGKEERVKFLQEAVVMGQFNHRNILRIFGIIFDNPLQTKIVVEIMPKGDLLHHLISLTPDLEEGQSECEELRALLLSYSRQIANGMGYLSLKKYIHRDLAARNVLVSDEDICKIADFGLSRNLQHEDNYISQGGKIPVKWTAPEALHYQHILFYFILFSFARFGLKSAIFTALIDKSSKNH